MSALIISSSGEPALDRRLDWARAYLDAGDGAAAAGMLADLTAEAPHFAAAWFLLGEALEGEGDRTAAAAAYAQALAREPEDRLGAALRLARLGHLPPEGAMSNAFVRALFDQYAPRFDTALREKLSYRGPEHVAQAVAGIAPGRHFGTAVDLGCGTGLAAPLFAPRCERLIGVDLSPGMLREAEALGLYAALHAGEMAAFLEVMPAGAVDLVLAVDALCYVADLVPVFRAARQVLAPGGLLAFTVETHAGDGMILRDTLRYAHGAALVRDALSASGFRPALIEPAPTRTEKGVPVPGLVAVAA